MSSPLPLDRTEEAMHIQIQKTSKTKYTYSVKTVILMIGLCSI